MIKQADQYLVTLFGKLIKTPKETEWIEFKHNNYNPQEIGEYISAMANTAALFKEDHAYVVWGVENESHKILGTSFNPKHEKKGNEELESWLIKGLDPKIVFRFFELNIEDKPIVILEISPAYSHPVQFYGAEYIRIGSNKVNLKKYPEIARQLWRIFEQVKFEEGIALDATSSEDILRLLDCHKFFEMINRPFPISREGIIHALKDNGFIATAKNDLMVITNLGALLFAKDFNDFRSIKRKILRIILYKGIDRTNAIKELTVNDGYAAGFDRYISTIYNLIPSHEEIIHGIRKTVQSYPELAIRELIANALIHQDFSITGSGPMVEIFDDRIEITNPGAPLVDKNRFVDAFPKSRNETLASSMRLIGLCEERGSGIDKVVLQTEINQLPAPLFESSQDYTKAILFTHRPYAELTKADRLNATYMHACLMFVQQKYLTNTSLRERFGIKEENSSMISRLVNEAIKSKIIKLVDPENKSRKHAKYQPIWA
jgi:predicted HTH transcriptional regulator